MSNLQQRVPGTRTSEVYVLAVTARAWRLSGPNALRRLRARRGAAAPSGQASRSSTSTVSTQLIGQP